MDIAPKLRFPLPTPASSSRDRDRAQEAYAAPKRSLDQQQHLRTSPSYDDSRDDGNKYNDHPFSFTRRRAVRGSRPPPTTVE